MPARTDPGHSAAAPEPAADGLHDTLGGSSAELGRLLSLIENDPVQRAAVLGALPAPKNPAWRIGITGSPGVGKSTLLARLVPMLADAERSTDAQGPTEPDARPVRPGVLAVDPSSPLTGGAVLGDRFRWAELARSGAFIRSLASRGSRGGVSAATGAAVRVLEAAGCDPIIIETVGSGQTGFEVLGLSDTVVVLLSPESGDALQLLKAGLLEVGDIFGVNKSDRPGADALLAEVRAALESGGPGERSDVWEPPALALFAERGGGVAELAAALRAHRRWLADLPPEHPRRLRRLRAELEYEVRALADAAVDSALREQGADLLAELRSGALTPAQAAARIFNPAE